MSQAVAKPRAPAKSGRRAKGASSTTRERLDSPTAFVNLSDKGGGRDGDTHKTITIVYQPKKGVDEYVRQVASATPMQLVEIERFGVIGSLIKDLAMRMDIPSSRIFTILGIPKATAEMKAAGGKMVAGGAGQAAIGMVKLLGIAQEIVANSTAPEAKGFDVWSVDRTPSALPWWSQACRPARYTHWRRSRRAAARLN
jgi:hypothetical protein